MTYSSTSLKPIDILLAQEVRPTKEHVPVEKSVPTKTRFIRLKNLVNHFWYRDSVSKADKASDISPTDSDTNKTDQNSSRTSSTSDRVWRHDQVYGDKVMVDR